MYCNGSRSNKKILPLPRRWEHFFFTFFHFFIHIDLLKPTNHLFTQMVTNTNPTGLQVECPAEFHVTEFHRNFAEFFPGIPPELSYGIPYFLRNSVCMRNSVYTKFRNAEFRIFTEFRMLRNSAFLRNSVCYVIMLCMLCNQLDTDMRNSVYTEFHKNAEFRKIRNSVKYGIPYYGIPYVTEFRIFTEFRRIQNSVLLNSEFHRYGIFTEFRRNSVFRIMNFVKKKSAGIFFDGIMDTLASRC